VDLKKDANNEYLVLVMTQPVQGCTPEPGLKPSLGCNSKKNSERGNKL